MSLDSCDDLADAILRALLPDSTDQLVEAISAMQATAAGEVRIHAEHQTGGMMLRLTDVDAGRAVQVVLDGKTCRDLAGYLTRPQR